MNAVALGETLRHVHHGAGAVTQLEISSSEIRDLIAAGRDPRFLMPDAVRNRIAETERYGKVVLEPARACGRSEEQ